MNLPRWPRWFHRTLKELGYACIAVLIVAGAVSLGYIGMRLMFMITGIPF